MKNREKRLLEAATLDIPGNWEEIIEGWCSPEFSKGCIIDDQPKPSFHAM